MEALGGPFESAFKRAMSSGEAVRVEALYRPVNKWLNATAYPSGGGLTVATLVTLGLGAQIGPPQRWMLGGLVVVVCLAFPTSFPLARAVARGLGAAGGWRSGLRALCESYASYGGSGALVGLFFALTLIEGGFPVAIHYVAGRALGLDPGWALYIAVVPLVYLVARLPVSLGGLGVLELSFVSLAGLLGLGWTDAFSIAALATALYLVALAPGALLYLLPAAAPRARMP